MLVLQLEHYYLQRRGQNMNQTCWPRLLELMIKIVWRYRQRYQVGQLMLVLQNQTLLLEHQIVSS